MSRGPRRSPGSRVGQTDTDINHNNMLPVSCLKTDSGISYFSPKKLSLLNQRFDVRFSIQNIRVEYLQKYLVTSEVELDTVALIL